MFPNSKQDQDVGDKEYKERANTDKPTVDSDHELQFVSICTGQSEETWEVTVKAVQHIRTTEG